MHPSEVNLFLAKQPGSTLRNLLARWRSRSEKDANFRRENPNASLYIADQLERVAKMVENPGKVRMALPSDELARIRAKAAALQASMGVAA